MIKRLENAGLGYHVDADKTIDKLGEAVLVFIDPVIHLKQKHVYCEELYWSRKHCFVIIYQIYILQRVWLLRVSTLKVALNKICLE